MDYFDTLTRFRTLGNPSKFFRFILDWEQQSRKSHLISLNVFMPSTKGPMLSTGLFKPRIGDFIQLGSEGLLSISSSFTFGFWGFSTGHYGLEY
ncbi:MAG TPA: hypothetical protein DCR17_07615 [Verrucomicrobiales bacterium]|nr:hypothetical protein [Verrucomicrobiales bacterium]